MKWIAYIVLAFMTSLAIAGETKLATGKLQAIDPKTGFLSVQGDNKSYPVAAGATLETHYKLTNFISLIPGMKVSLFSEDGHHISRIFIHGPYSLIKQAETH